MPLIVENGTGLANAEAYLSATDMRAYCEARGMNIPGHHTDASLEEHLRIACEYIDSRWRYKGARLLSTQGMEWPRSGVIDWSSMEVTGIPKRLKQATAELAFKALTEINLFTDVDRSARVRSESVGPISTSYADDAPAMKVFSIAEHLLKQYIRDPLEQGAPIFGGSDEAYFSFGMMDNRTE